MARDSRILKANHIYVCANLKRILNFTQVMTAMIKTFFSIYLVFTVYIYINMYIYMNIYTYM